MDDDLDALVGFEAVPRHALGLVEQVEHVQPDRQAFACRRAASTYCTLTSVCDSAGVRPSLPRPA